MQRSGPLLGEPPFLSADEDPADWISPDSDSGPHVDAATSPHHDDLAPNAVEVADDDDDDDDADEEHSDVESSPPATTTPSPPPSTAQSSSQSPTSFPTRAL
ncbi:unnamed protein product [Linum trigynum]